MFKVLFTVFLSAFLACFFYFSALNDIEPTIEKGIFYLSSRQNNDGSFKHFLADDPQMQVNVRKMGNTEASMFISCALKLSELPVQPVLDGVYNYLLESRSSSDKTWSYFQKGDQHRYEERVPYLWVDPLIPLTSMGYFLLSDYFSLSPSEISDFYERYQASVFRDWGLYHSFFRLPPPSIVITLSNPVYIQESILSLLLHHQYSWSDTSLLSALKRGFELNSYWDDVHASFFHPVLNLMYMTWVVQNNPAVNTDIFHMLIWQFEDRFLSRPLAEWDVFELSGYLAAKSQFLHRNSLGATLFLDRVYQELRFRQLEDGSWPIDSIYRFDYTYNGVRNYLKHYARAKESAAPFMTQSLLSLLQSPIYKTDQSLMGGTFAQYMGSSEICTAFSLYALSRYQLLR